MIDRATIDETGSRSVADVLSRQLGAEIVPTLAGDGIQLQGIDARGILVLVDGQEVIGKIGGSVDLANLLVDDVERIEIVKGAGSAVYGSDALGGVINVLTRTATQPIALTNRDGRIDDFSPALNLWDARIAKDLGRQVQVFLGADNLFAEQDVRYFPSPGRRVYAGASVRYSR